MSKKVLIGGLVALLLALGGWYFASPGYAMMQLRDAALAGNEAKLETRIDFPRVREGLKADLSEAMTKEMQSSDSKEGSVNAAGAALAMAMIGPMIDGLVTPSGMANVVKTGKLGKAGPAANSDEDTNSFDKLDWTVERDGFSRFTAIAEGENGEGSLHLIFERDGLGWKLVKLEMPDEAFEN